MIAMATPIESMIRMESISKGCWVCWKSFIAEPLGVCYRVSKNIPKAPIGDIACYP